MNKGYIVQVLGPVVDVCFPTGQLPKINDALRIDLPAEQNNGFAIKLTLEVALHIGDNTVRCIAMDATEGLSRGLEVIDTESINAIINDDELVTGISGCSVDINKSYENMKKLNNYSDKMLRYKDLIPKITSINYYDKYITGGNNLNRNISIVVYLEDSLDKLKEIDDIRLNLFLDGMLLKVVK